MQDQNKAAVSEVWQEYFDACKTTDWFRVFDAMVALRLRPVPIGLDRKTHKVKIPQGDNWGLITIEERRARLGRMIKSGKIVGLGCQADGYVVLDIDPPDKDRRTLGRAWKEAASVLLGGEDWPNTLTIRTQAGCHVWFKTTPKIQAAWVDSGKQEIPLPSGGQVEFFTGNKAQMQVACPPSEGKAVAMEQEPADMPESVEMAILELVTPRTAAPARTVVAKSRSASPASQDDEGWFRNELAYHAKRNTNAREGERHGMYRKTCRLMAGLAAGMNLMGMEETIYQSLASAHREAKPEVSDYVLSETFRWAWDRGVTAPLWREHVESEEGGVATKTRKKVKLTSLNSDSALPEEAYTDLKFAEMVIAAFGERFRYIESWKIWASWDGEKGVWVQSQCLHHELFKEFATGDDSYLGSMAKIKSAASMAMSDKRVMAYPDQFDAQVDYLNLKNGVLDLISGQLLDHDPAFMSTKQADVEFIPSAKCPKFIATLEQVQPDPEIRLFLQRWLGTVLCGRTLAESVVNYGDGANGKSTILESVGLMMGTYFAKMPRGFIAKTKGDRHPAELVTLYGARFALASETDISDALDESKIKMILGDGSITARRMNENFWSFNPTHKFAIAANHMPSIVGQDSGIWRRLAFVPWTVTIPEEQRQPEYEKVLHQEESSGILNWLLEGYRQHQAIGLAIPDKIKAAGKDVQESSDWLGEFFSENLTTQPKPGYADADRIRASQVYELYKKWAVANGAVVLASNKAIPLFTKRVEQLRATSRRLQNVTWYIGLRIKDESDHQYEADGIVIPAGSPF